MVNEPKPTSTGSGQPQTGVELEKLTIAFRGSESYRDRLQDAARARKIKVQELIERAIESYLAGSSAEQVAAERAAAAPPGHQLIPVPSDTVPLVKAVVRWRKEFGKRDRTI